MTPLRLTVGICAPRGRRYNPWHAADVTTYDDGTARSLCGRRVFVEHDFDGSPMRAGLVSTSERTTGQDVECRTCVRIMAGLSDDGMEVTT